jgi:hypothetical protein
METDKLFNVIILDWTTEKMKIDIDLQTIVNSNEKTKKKSKLIRKLVNKLLMIELNIEKFNTMITINENKIKEE